MSEVTEQKTGELATEAATPASIVEALKAVAGNPPKVRASFAKGRCVRGHYAPSDRAAEITRSVSFTKPGRVLARFSMGGGNPKVPDTNNLVLRGFSFRIETEGQTSDILVESAPVHFARTLDQMLAFLKARIPGADGKPDPSKVKAFSEANPETLNQAKYVAARPLPASFAGTTYWGVHSFPVTNAAGMSRFVKFKVVPLVGDLTLTEDEAKEQAPDFLHRDLGDRIRDGGLAFNVMALLDRPGDPTMDVTVRWPDEDEREAVLLGTITIEGIEEDDACDISVFDPGTLAEGIGYPPDEMFAARLKAYRISLAKRR
ncbi:MULTISPECIES: catalase family peroxidase [unclassified Rhizobium]|uniref:catalase family peroxidase n=1 Tax=unclassified Rhizobium TaxID=2613769 RepID=UPI00160C9939|nr:MULTISPECIES: catalase family peroxidase [unclassified Rhizobium]MBB3543045.1 catalase [Rhizobium sp. BK399]MCS3742262.1 catalase [Rhizobium sp. BK661]